jgi:hypothetical protein
VSWHAIKDCKTFLKLQEVAKNNKPKQGGKAMMETQAMHRQQINKQPTEWHKDKVSQTKETIMMEDTSHPKDISPQ